MPTVGWWLTLSLWNTQRVGSWWNFRDDLNNGLAYKTLTFPYLVVAQVMGELGFLHTLALRALQTRWPSVRGWRGSTNDVPQIAWTAGDRINEGFTSLGRELNFNSSDLLAVLIVSTSDIVFTPRKQTLPEHLLCFGHNSKHFTWRQVLLPFPLYRHWLSGRATHAIVLSKIKLCLGRLNSQPSA